MGADLERRRVLVAAADADRAALCDLFARRLVDGWEASEADSFEQARFLLQHDPCDVLLVDHSLYQPEDSDGLAWLAGQQQVPVAFVAGPDPSVTTDALGHGVNQWLPRDLALSHPPLLAAVLDQAASKGDLRRSNRLLGEALQECRRQVRRLVTLLWGLSPIERHARWFTQRHMMERLQEEIARAERGGAPLAVALGEVRANGPEAPAPDPPQMAAWTAERVTRHKRRTDVAGQYGPAGFLLLLSHTNDLGALACCRRLQKQLEETGGQGAAPPGTIRAYFGISAYSPTHATAQRLLGRAEEALERAKADGEVRVVV